MSAKLTESALSEAEEALPRLEGGARHKRLEGVACASSGVLMEDLVHDFPRPVDFEKREHIRVAMTIPVIEFEPDRGNGIDDVDTRYPGLELCRWAIVVDIVKELLHGASEELSIRIAEDRRILVEGGLHIGASPRLGAINIILDGLGNRIILTDVDGCAAHDSVFSSASRVPISVVR
jgi:hypothetical protein